jgi:hypothetical protein
METIYRRQLALVQASGVEKDIQTMNEHCCNKTPTEADA